MTKIGAYTPETSRMILDVVKYLVDSGFVITRPGRGMQNHLPQESPIYVRNDSGEEMPPFACMQVTGTVEAGGQNYVTVDKPADTTGDAGEYLFNSLAPVENGKYGIAYAGPLVRVITNGSTVTCGDSWQPVVNQWYVATGGSLLSAVGDDDIETDVMRAFIQTSGGTGDTHYLFTLTGTITGGGGAATIRNMADDTEIATGQTVNDPLGHFEGLTAGYRGICFLQNGEYYALGPYVTQVRWDDPDLEYSRDDGTTWINIDTAEDCT